jgi:hypothetical protein
MKYLSVDQLEPGKLYLFRHAFNSKRIIFQPARFIGIHESGRPQVEWVLQGFRSSVPVGDGLKAAAVLTEKWLQDQMLALSDEVLQLQAQASTLYDAYKEVKA